MRTGNKLLLAFVAFFVLLMLFADIILWANLKKGITGNTDSVDDGVVEYSIALQPVNVLKLTGMDSTKLRVEKSGTYKLEYRGAENQFTYSQSGDTLSIGIKRDGDVEFHCPDIKTILMTHSNVVLTETDFSHLQVIADDSCEIELHDIVARYLYLTGKVKTLLSVTGQSTIDSLDLKLDKQSEFYSGEDVSYKYTNMKIDSIKELDIRVKSLNMLKGIK